MAKKKEKKKPYIKSYIKKQPPVLPTYVLFAQVGHASKSKVSGVKDANFTPRERTGKDFFTEQ